VKEFCALLQRKKLNGKQRILNFVLQKDAREDAIKHTGLTLSYLESNRPKFYRLRRKKNLKQISKEIIE